MPEQVRVPWSSLHMCFDYFGYFAVRSNGILSGTLIADFKISRPRSNCCIVCLCITKVAKTKQKLDNLLTKLYRC